MTMKFVCGESECRERVLGADHLYHCNGTDEVHQRRFLCTRCQQRYLKPACECDECGAYPICSLCKKAHEEDGEHD